MSAKNHNQFKNSSKLPVYAHKAEFLELLHSNQCIILIGKTGSGKTTQIPQWCVEFLEKNQSSGAKRMKKVVCTQPRRVAAISVARRVAYEMNVALGKEVGYSVRFDDCTSLDTKLKFATDGRLVREAIGNRHLEQYEIVILDEAHERKLSTDILISLLKETMPKRPDLKVVIMSATVNTEQFRKYFTGSPVLEIPGRLFKVEIHHTKEPKEDYVKAAVSTVIDIHKNESKGDILVFLTGEEEIESACEKIRSKASELKTDSALVVLPLYSNLPSIEQQKIFKPVPQSEKSFTRKCIVSTNIAETSLTIEGIHFVVDAGFCKRKCFSPKSRIEYFQISPISKASANQRAGRAGRTSSGTCYHLYTEACYDEMEDYTPPEIMTCNLATLVLLLKCLSVDNLVTFDYMSPPYPESMIRALDLLYELRAINEEGELTEDGKIMSELPLDPPLAKMLIMASRKYKCGEEILDLVSILSVQYVFIRPATRKDEAAEARAKFTRADGDHLTLIGVFKEFVENGKSPQWCRDNYLGYHSLNQAVNVKAQLEKAMARFNLPCISLPADDLNYSEDIRKCILEGYFAQVVTQYGTKSKGIYACVKDGTKKIIISPASGHAKEKHPWIVYTEFIRTHGKFAFTVSPIDPKWLLEIAPDYFKPDEFEPEYIINLLEAKAKEKEEKRKQEAQPSNNPESPTDKVEEHNDASDDADMNNNLEKIRELIREFSKLPYG